MRFLILVIVWISLFISGCKQIEAPRFEQFEQLELQDIQNSSVSLLGKARYYNPNQIGGKLKTFKIKCYANEVFVSEIEQNIEAEVEPNSRFVIPIEIDIPFDKIINKESGLFGQILNTLLQKEVRVKYEGEASVSIGGVTFDLPINQIDTLQLRI